MIPGVQNPHCRPPSFAKALTTVSFLPSSRPSIVTISLPSMRLIGAIQALRGLLSINTVQHPHTPSGAHPSLGEIISSTSRKYVIRDISGSPSYDIVFPFNLNSILLLTFQEVNHALSVSKDFYSSLFCIYVSINSSYAILRRTTHSNWTTERMLPSLSLNHAPLTPPMVAIPCSSVISYCSNTTPFSRRSFTTFSTSSTSHPAAV